MSALELLTGDVLQAADYYEGGHAKRRSLIADEAASPGTFQANIESELNGHFDEAPRSLEELNALDPKAPEAKTAKAMLLRALAAECAVPHATARMARPRKGASLPCGWDTRTCATLARE